MNKARKIFSALTVCVIALFVTACASSKKTFMHGTWNDKTFTSEFLGIKLPLGSDWVIYSDEDLAKTLQMSDYSDSSIKAALDKGSYIYDMMAVKRNGTSMNISIMDNDKTVSVGEKEFFTAGMPIIKARYEAQGYECTAEKNTISFLGKNTDCIDMTLVLNGKTLYLIHIPIFQGHYTAEIAAVSFEKAELYSLLGSITAV